MLISSQLAALVCEAMNILISIKVGVHESTRMPRCIDYTVEVVVFEMSTPARTLEMSRAVCANIQCITIPCKLNVDEEV